MARLTATFTPSSAFAPNAAHQSSVNGSMANCIQGKYEKLRPQKRGQVCWDALTPAVFSRSRKTGTLSPSRDCHESSVFDGGVGNGDPGNWSLEGTNGSAVLGCNEGSSCSPTFSFFSPVTEVSLDIGESEGFASFTVSGYLDDTLVDSETLDINDPNESTGTWDTFSLTGLMDEVVISSADVGAYGVDNVVFPSTPEPATWSIAAGGLGLMIAVWCRRKRAA